jgi:hypothetical protein
MLTTGLTLCNGASKFGLFLGQDTKILQTPTKGPMDTQAIAKINLSSFFYLM